MALMGNGLMCRGSQCYVGSLAVMFYRPPLPSQRSVTMAQGLRNGAQQVRLREDLLTILSLGSVRKERYCLVTEGSNAVQAGDPSDASFACGGHRHLHAIWPYRFHLCSTSDTLHRHSGTLYSYKAIITLLDC